MLLVALGGAIGSVLRYLTSVIAAFWFGVEFPYGTLIVNLVGAFLIGLVQELGAESLTLSDNTRLLLTTGVMGGLTTYSTFSYETVRLIEARSWHYVVANVVFTTGACLALCVLGMAAGRYVLGARG